MLKEDVVISYEYFFLGCLIILSIGKHLHEKLLFYRAYKYFFLLLGGDLLFYLKFTIAYEYLLEDSF